LKAEIGETKQGWKRYIIDIEMEFLCSNLEKSIFITKPIGYNEALKASLNAHILTEEEAELIDENKQNELGEAILSLYMDDFFIMRDKDAIEDMTKN